MTSTKKKTGRPQAVYKASNGTRIPGLTKLKDGRWRVSGKEKHTYTEADELLAIAYFRQYEAKRDAGGKEYVNLRVGNDDVHAVGPLIRKAVKNRVVIRIPRDHTKGVTVERSFESDELWAWLRQQILKRPKYVAERVGIEEIGYLTDLVKPTESPKMTALLNLYTAKPGLSQEEAARAKRMWEEFVKIVGVTTLRELTHDHVELYEQKITESDLGPKSIKHRYSRVRTVIAYALKRGRHAKDCRQALDRLAMLEVDTPDALDPDPITPAQFWKIHGEATKAGNVAFAAMMVFSLNAALYPSEAGAVRWSDIDLERGEFVTRRRKTGVPRVGVLWPETVKAIKALPQDRETVFNTSRQAYARFSVFRDWCIYRTAAKLPDVKYAQIRDASFTTACRLNLDQARVLAGHRLPGAVDNYVLRQPRFVAPVCQAIHDEFCAGR